MEKLHVPKKSLACLGCQSAADALLVLPQSYIDKTHCNTTFSGSLLNVACLWKATVTDSIALDKDNLPTRSPFPRKRRFSLALACGTVLEATAYGMADFEEVPQKDEKITFCATLQQTQWGLKAQGFVHDTPTGKIEPVYKGVPGQIDGKTIQAHIVSALNDSEAKKQAVALLQASVVALHTMDLEGFTPSHLLRAIHLPKTVKEGFRALEVARLCTVRLVQASASQAGSRTQIPMPMNVDASMVLLVARQKETLSQGQRSALNIIRKTLNGTVPARVLLNGDVGSGKTLVFLLAMASVCKAGGGRVAVMVPSELVARQIHLQAVSRFPELNPVLFAGSDAPKKLSAASRMIVGTQALLSVKDIGSLDLVVIDEQHRFSVDQREALLDTHTHLIEASATPIPRSLALALFDGWTDASIRGYPVQKVIRSHSLTDDKRQDAKQILKKHLFLGKKLVFLYPLVSSSDKAAASVVQAAERLENYFPGKVVVLHGKMKPEEKNANLALFASGEKPIAVASTVIEIGVDIPDIGCMLVNNADRFGVAQLHQLRGRLARNGGDADFIMMTKASASKHTQARLGAVRDNLCGFALAEQDMHLRGFGEVIGEMQSGNTQTLFKLARLGVDDFLGEVKTKIASENFFVSQI